MRVPAPTVQAGQIIHLYRYKHSMVLYLRCGAALGRKGLTSGGNLNRIIQSAVMSEFMSTLYSHRAVAVSGITPCVSVAQLAALVVTPGINRTVRSQSYAEVTAGSDLNNIF